jgi:hypothetical protein
MWEKELIGGAESVFEEQRSLQNMAPISREALSFNEANLSYAALHT